MLLFPLIRAIKEVWFLKPKLVSVGKRIIEKKERLLRRGLLAMTSLSENTDNFVIARGLIPKQSLLYMIFDFPKQIVIRLVGGYGAFCPRFCLFHIVRRTRAL